MKDKFRQFEEKIQRFVEKQALRALGIPGCGEMNYLQRLVQAMQDEAHVNDKQGQTDRPQHLHAEHPPQVCNVDMQSNQELLDKLAAAPDGSRSVNSIVHFDATVTINIFPDENVAPGEFEVHAMWKRPSTGSDRKHPHRTGRTPAAQAIPVSNAFLIIDGADIYNLDKEVVNIGRKLDNDLVLDDPRVSRKHGQLRAIKGTLHTSV